MGRGWRTLDWRWLAGGLILAVAAALIAASLAGRRVTALARVQAAGDAQLRAALLDGELARYNLVPLTLADDRDVIAAVSGEAGARRRLDRKLESLSRVTGAPVIYVIAADGTTLAASNWRTPQSFVGSSYRFRPYFREAMANGAASQYAMGTVSHRPGLYLSRRTARGGVVVVKLEFGPVEREWARAGGIALVRDARGIVLVTSRPDWRFAVTGRLTPAQAAGFRAETRPPPGALTPLPLTETSAGMVGGGVTYAVGEAPVRWPGWRLTLLRPVDGAVAGARRSAALIAALAVLALTVLGWAWRQRAMLVRRRTAELEEEVAARTADLRREMDERAEGEARAAVLREALRQANRLAALGQITASVAHETAQPVAAIRTYAQTSATLLDRGALDEVRANLGLIARLADRIGAVTARLRGFSRRGKGQLRPVSVTEVIEGAQLILKEQLRTATLTLPAVDPALMVTGGRIRLEQVLVNLIQNALDAMAEQRDRRIAITLSSDDEHLRLVVADNGPGIAPDFAARLFTPFVTSRPQGLGLGLVIAQDIMVEMGGWLKLLPAPHGAAFEVGMRRA